MGILRNYKPQIVEDHIGLENLGTITPSVKAGNITGIIVDHYAKSASLSLSLNKLCATMNQLKLIRGFTEIVRNHSLSAPVAATMRAVPGFIQAAKSFPESALYNLVPEHKSSPRFSMGLESLGEAEGEVSTAVGESVTDVVDTFDNSLTYLSVHAESLKEQVAAAKASISANDTDETIFGLIPVNTLSEEAFDKILGMLEKYLREVAVFNVDDLRANPEKVKEEIDGLVDLTGDLGRVLGLDITENGLVESDKDSAFEPTETNISAKKLTKETIIFFLDRADELLDQLHIIGLDKDTYVDALRSESQDMPAEVSGDETNYGVVDHVALINSYVTLTSKLINETVILVQRLVNTAVAVEDATSLETE